MNFWPRLTYAAAGGAFIGWTLVDCVLYAAAVFHGVDSGPLHYMIASDAAAAAIAVFYSNWKGNEK